MESLPEEKEVHNIIEATIKKELLFGFTIIESTFINTRTLSFEPLKSRKISENGYE